MLNYLEELRGIWGDEAVKLFILKAGISAYPIIKANGGSLHAPLAVIVSNEKIAEDVLGELKGFGSMEIVPLELKKKEFEESLMNAEYEMIPIICSDKGKRSYDNLVTLKNAMLYEKINGRHFSPLPVVVCIGGVPNEFANLFSGQIIFEGENRISNLANSEEIVRKLLDILIANASEIQNMVKNLSGNDNSLFLNSIEKVTEFVLHQVSKMPMNIAEQMLEDMETVSKKVEMSWTPENDYSIWIELLREMIIKHEIDIYMTIDRNKASLAAMQMVNDSMIYDEKYYYITTNFFDEVCNDVPYVGKLELKRALSDSGILIGEGAERSYYTVKVPVITAMGVQVVGRRLRLSRKWLDKPGELTWYEQINIQKKKGKENSREVRPKVNIDQQKRGGLNDKLIKKIPIGKRQEERVICKRPERRTSDV